MVVMQGGFRGVAVSSVYYAMNLSVCPKLTDGQHCALSRGCLHCATNFTDECQLRYDYDRILPPCPAETLPGDPTNSISLCPSDFSAEDDDDKFNFECRQQTSCTECGSVMDGIFGTEPQCAWVYFQSGQQRFVNGECVPRREVSCILRFLNVFS